MKFTKDNLNQTLWVHPHTLDSARKWRLVDATDKTLGKLAVEIVRKLTGKEKAHYADHWDCGDYVVVTNAEKFAVSGNKMEQKLYRKHTRWKGHLQETPLDEMLAKNPTHPLFLAVKGMLPKNKMRKARLKRLKLISGAEHTYADKQLLDRDGRTAQ